MIKANENQANWTGDVINAKPEGETSSHSEATYIFKIDEDGRTTLYRQPIKKEDEKK